MIVINECRINPDGKCLVIEATVDNLEYFDKVYIDSVIVNTDETYLPSDPNEEKGYKITFEGEKKHIKISITAKEMGMDNLNDNMFFIYVVAGGIPAEDTPCGMDNCYTMCVAVNMRPVYNMAMGYIKELGNTCNIPKGFIDMVLRLKAYDLSLRTGNYPMAIKQWKNFFKNKVSISTSNKGCGCHGLN